MNKAANSYWTDTRLAAQRPAARALTLASPLHEFPSPRGGAATATAASVTATRTTTVVAATRADVRHRRFAIPSWVVFGMVILATFALCVSVTMRTHAERLSAEQKYERMNVEVESLRHTNRTIERQVERLQTRDAHAIEAAARANLNMVRADEIVVPVE